MNSAVDKRWLAKDRYSVWHEPGSLLGRKLTAANVTSSHTNLTPARNTNLTLILDKSSFAYVTQIWHHTSYTDLAKISCMIKAKVRIDVLGIQVLKPKGQANVHPHIWHWYSRDFLFDLSWSFKADYHNWYVLGIQVLKAKCQANVRSSEGGA